MVVFATPDRRATSSTVKPPTPLSLSSSKAFVRTRSRDRRTRPSTALAPRSVDGGPERWAGWALEVRFAIDSAACATIRLRSVVTPRLYPPKGLSMDFASIRMITDDLERVVQFYERITGVAAIRHTQTTQLFGTDSARPADNHTVIIEFRVEDVDSEYERLKPLVDDWVQEPTTMPWGNRSILFRDPDGNLVNFFTPVTEEAIGKFSR